MGPPGLYQRDTPLNQPPAVNMIIVQADQDGRWIESDLSVAPHDSLQGKRVAMGQRFSHPGIGVGETVGVEETLSGQGIDHRAIANWVAFPAGIAQ